MDRTSYRWRICALLFFATTINYLDRQVLGLLKPELAVQFSWTEAQYSYIVVAFTICYAFGMAFAGKVVDTIGVKLGYGLYVFVWSLAACGHGLVRSTLGFGVMRGLLGIAEAGGFPCAVKSVAEWFPRKEQAFAVGILTSGTSIGAVAAPAVVPWLAASYGWEMAFIVTGVLGFFWLAFWYVMYQRPLKHAKVNQEELRHIADGQAVAATAEPAASWASLLKMPATWAFCTGKFLTDPIWWFMLFWLPSYFNSRFHLDMKSLGLPLVVVYTATSFGSIGGGWISSKLIDKGWDIHRARRTTMLAFAMLVVPVVASPLIENMWAMVALLSLAAASHQAWSANLFTTASDMFPKALVGSVVGIGGLAGALGATLFPLLVGAILDHFKALGDINLGYNILFAISGCAYLLAWLAMRTIRARQARADLRGTAPV